MRSFTPPRCPHGDCPMHASPAPAFFRRHGSYRAKCRAHPVPRFVCRVCGRGFSRQTFRMDYRDHKPHLNATLFTWLASGLGLRQFARTHALTLRCTELKFRKLARHLRWLNTNFRRPFDEDVELLFDEMETYEGCRNTRPLTVPGIIEKKSRFILGMKSAPIRPSGRMTKQRLERIEADERRFGRRPNRSRAACRVVLRHAAELCRFVTATLYSDEKTTYPPLIDEAFEGVGYRLLTTNSELVRTTFNPLFHINHTEAMARDLSGRLRRESWLASKARCFLNRALQIHMAYRNFVRQRFNYDPRSSAEHLGLCERRLRPTELLAWRQDWGQDSIHTIARAGESVAEALGAA